MVEHIVILDVLKGSMTLIAIILHGQQLLAKQRKEFRIG
jgi:hypothetical protein